MNVHCPLFFLKKGNTYPLNVVTVAHLHAYSGHTLHSVLSQAHVLQQYVEMIRPGACARIISTSQTPHFFN